MENGRTSDQLYAETLYGRNPSFSKRGLNDYSYCVRTMIIVEVVQRWYMDLNRQMIAEKGKDYIGDKLRWFWFGDHGNLFLPGKDRSV